MSEPTFSLAICSICRKPIELEHCKTDDHGQAVHEECQLHMLTGKEPPFVFES
jgi:hypothetical protein